MVSPDFQLHNRNTYIASRSYPYGCFEDLNSSASNVDISGFERS